MASPVEIVTNFLESFTRNDPDAIASFVSDGFRNEHLSALGSNCSGRAEYRRRLPHFLDAFADRHYLIDDIVDHVRESTTDVVVRYRFLAAYENTQFEVPGIMWFTLADGLITSRVDVWDSKTFLEQTS